ncbi:hypothetical protein N752_09960 [Desulforamulus aquiferis]|nr:hypothetical protein N752_09960 [Desulforamulus aquiferis]
MISVSADKADRLIKLLHELGVEDAAVVGELTKTKDHLINIERSSD